MLIECQNAEDYSIHVSQYEGQAIVFYYKSDDELFYQSGVPFFIEMIRRCKQYNTIKKVVLVDVNKVKVRDYQGVALCAVDKDNTSLFYNGRMDLDALKWARVLNKVCEIFLCEDFKEKPDEVTLAIFLNAYKEDMQYACCRLCDLISQKKIDIELPNYYERILRHFESLENDEEKGNFLYDLGSEIIEIIDEKAAPQSAYAFFYAAYQCGHREASYELARLKFCKETGAIGSAERNIEPTMLYVIYDSYRITSPHEKDEIEKNLSTLLRDLDYAVTQGSNRARLALIGIRWENNRKKAVDHCMSIVISKTASNPEKDSAKDYLRLLNETKLVFALHIEETLKKGCQFSMSLKERLSSSLQSSMNKQQAVALAQSVAEKLPFFMNDEEILKEAKSFNRLFYHALRYIQSEIDNTFDSLLYTMLSRTKMLPITLCNDLNDVLKKEYSDDNTDYLWMYCEIGAFSKNAMKKNGELSSNARHFFQKISRGDYLAKVCERQAVDVSTESRENEEESSPTESKTAPPPFNIRGTIH